MTVLVTGATGTVAAPLVADLARRRVPTRAFVRDPAKARRMLGESVELAVGDFGEPPSIRRALAGVDQVFLACANDRRQVAYEMDVIDAAAEAGVRRLVKLSAVGAEVGSPAHYWDWHGRIEAYLRDSGLPATVLRPTFYLTNLLANADAVRHTGTLFAPAEGAKIAMIDPRDVAAAAAAVLTTPEHDGRTYTLTGPEAVTFDDVAACLTTATGRAVSFVAVPDPVALDGLRQAGLPSWVAEQLVTVFGQLRQGVAAHPTDTVQALTGRPARSLLAFAADHARAFRPS